MRRCGTVGIVAFLLTGAVLLPANAFAQSKLPWADANPLEGSARGSAKPRRTQNAKTEKPHESVEAGKPAEGKAFGKPADAAPPAFAAAPVTATDAPEDVPTPDPRPEPSSKEAPAGSDEAATANPPAASADGSAPSFEESTPVPGRPDAVRPIPAEAKPIEEIPVPDERPADPQQPAGDAKRDDPKPPVEGEGAAEPSRPQDAPNSTEKLKSRGPVIDPATSVIAAAAIDDAKTCEAELKARGATFAVGESISEGECGVLRPVAIDRLSSGVTVAPKTQMLCRTALALDIWMSDAVVPAARTNFPGRKLTEFRQASTYVCRPRASESGISEHARGSAIDIGAFVFDEGEDIGVAAQPAGSAEARFQDAVRTQACGPFKTVLGPGTDPDHATHFHLDIAARRNGATYCR